MEYLCTPNIIWWKSMWPFTMTPRNPWSKWPLWFNSTWSLTCFSPNWVVRLQVKMGKKVLPKSFPDNPSPTSLGFWGQNQVPTAIWRSWCFGQNVGAVQTTLYPEAMTAIKRSMLLCFMCSFGGKSHGQNLVDKIVEWQSEDRQYLSLGQVYYLWRYLLLSLLSA